MIRIETTAEFDAEGRFALVGQTQVSIAPGPRRVTIVINDADLLREPNAVALQKREDALLQRVNGVLVWTGRLLEDPEEARQRLDDEWIDWLLRGFN